MAEEMELPGLEAAGDVVQNLGDRTSNRANWWRPGSAFRAMRGWRFLQLNVPPGLKWLGRSRPLTGGGATEDVGSSPGAYELALKPVAQTGMPSSVLAVSFNPHTSWINAQIVGSPWSGEESHAPSNQDFHGIAVAKVTPFLGGGYTSGQVQGFVQDGSGALGNTGAFQP
jgi:hypothetical protein